MVDYPHLSGGNSSSSPSRDLCADFGVSIPRSLDAEDVSPDLDMGESDPIPLAFDCGSVNSSDSTDPAPEPLFPLMDSVLLPSEVPNVFKAAHHFAQQANVDVVAERKKNQTLSDFIRAKGFSLEDVNSFSLMGAPSRSVDDFNVVTSSGKQMLDKSSHKVSTAQLPSSGLLGVSGLKVAPGLASEASPSPEIPPLISTPLPPSPSWANVVLKSTAIQSISLDYCPPDGTLAADGTILVKPHRDFLKEGNSRWNTCLVGGFSHSRPPFKVVDESAHRLWGKFGLEKVFMQDKDQFVFKFSLPENRDNVLASGPWYISNKLLVLHHWREGVNFKSEVCTKLPVWVKLLNVPLSYWSPKGLSFLASAIGKPLMVDEPTSKLIPMNFARICVEIDNTSLFPAELDVVVLDELTDTELVKKVYVEYQSRPRLCNHCKSFGHSVFKCPHASYHWVPKASSVPPPPAPVPAPARTTASDMTTVMTENFVGESVTPSPLTKEILPPEDWKSIARGPKSSAVPYTQPPLTGPINNRFTPISAPSEFPVLSPSDNDSTPTPNPLRDKLKAVDEKDCRDIKAKAKAVDAPCKKSAKKAKGGGRKSPA